MRTILKSVLCCAAILFVNLLNSQTSNFYFSFFGGAVQDIGNDIVQARDSSLIVVGNTGSFHSVQTDIYLAKVNSKLHAKWQKNIGGNLTDVGKSVVELKDSSIVIAGYTSSFGAGGYDAFIVKTSRNGEVIWQKTFGGGGWDLAYSVISPNDSTLMICGSTTSFDRGKMDAFVLRMDTAGAILSYKIYGGTEDDELRQIITTSDGGYVAVGSTKSYGDSVGNIWLTKFTATGDSSWFKSFGRGYDDIGNSVEQDLNNDYLIAGGTDTVGNGKHDVYLLKLTSNGDFVWERFYGLANEDEQAYKIKRPSSSYGSMMICHSTKEISTFKTDAKALLLDVLGYYLDGGRIGSYENEEVFSISTCHDKGFALVGYTGSYNAQQQDIFVVKFDSLVKGTGSLVVQLPEQDLQTEAIRIFPNPFNGVLNIAIPNEQIGLIEIKDLMGKIKYLKTEINAAHYVLSDLKLSSGIYFLQVRTNARLYTTKLICNSKD
jgi:hypothetical protein